MRTLIRIAAVFAASMPIAACGVDGSGSSSGAAAADESNDDPQAAQLAQSCSNADAGLQVRYPEGWHADDRCEWFHPEAFDLPRQQDVPGIAIHVREEPVSLARATSGGPTTVELSRTSDTVQGRGAVRREVRATGSGLMPEGTHAVHWTVGLDGGRSIRASTYSVGDHDYDESREVLDSMVDELELEDG